MEDIGIELVEQSGKAGSAFFCSNAVDGSFFNSCRAQWPAGPWTLVASLQQFIHPKELALLTVGLLLLLPALLLEEKPRFGFALENVRRYQKARLNILNVLHRLSYALILSIGLQVIFSQERPCNCSSGNQVNHIGTVYGMPNEQVLCAALFGSMLIDFAPYFPIIARIVGVLVVLWSSVENIVLGTSSLGQAVVGALMGVILHFYSTRLPQYIVFVDAMVEIVLTFILVMLDPALQYSKGDPNNLVAWFFWGLAFELFTCFTLLRHFQSLQGLKLMRHSLKNLNKIADKEDDPNSDSESLVFEDDFVSDNFWEISDLAYTGAFLVVMFALLLLSKSIEQYSWLHSASRS